MLTGSQLPYFEDLALSALHALDAIAQFDNLARSNFYKNLPQIVSRLPKVVFILLLVEHTDEQISLMRES